MPRRKMVKPTLHEWDGKKPEQFMKVLCELGVDGKEIWVKDRVIVRTPSLEE